MNIFFLNTPGDYPNQFPPLGLMYLASTCRKEGHNVFLYDLGAQNVQYDECMKELNSADAQVLCISVYTTQLLRTIELINEIRNSSPRLRIVVGGPHISALPSDTMRACPAVDYEVFGEGEVTLLELLSALASSTPPNSIKGLCYREGSTIVQNESRDRLTDLDSIPFPAVDMITRFRYSYDKFACGKKVGVAVSSRGCPFNCTFCNKAVFGNKYIRRSPENLIAELGEQKRILGIDEIYFVDDLFVTDEAWLSRFLDLYQASGINLPWKCLGRVDQVDGAMYKRMKAAGCFLVQFGVESGDQQILKSIKKGIKIEKVREAVASCRKAGINTATYFIFGHPGETAETALRTLLLACQLNADVCHFFVLVPFPGTANYRLVPEPLQKDWQRIRYYHKGQFPISLCDLDPEELFHLEKQARYEFYGRLGYFIRNPLAFRFPFKHTVVKSGASIAYFIIRIFLMLSGKRIVTRLRQKTRRASK